MKKIILLLIIFSINFSSCGYNTLQEQDEIIKSSWSEILNQYQRRADLIPNLVNVVKGYATHEKQILEEVTNARSRVGEIKVTSETLNDPEKFKEFQAAQAQLGSALSRLIAVSENYPQLKADGVFRDLMTQLEGTENRVAVARHRYIDAVQNFNVTVRSFPSNLTAKWFAMTTKQNFAVENEKAISTPPKVEFLKMLKRCFVIFIILGFLPAIAETPVPHFSSYVVDQTSTLNNSEKSGLETKLTEFSKNKGSQIAILVVNSIQPETIEQFAIRVFDDWKLGRKGVDDGVLLVIAKTDRKLRIEVGRGLEGAVTDITTKRIIDEIITPQFKAGQFFLGIDQGVDSLIKLINGEPLPPPSNGSFEGSIFFFIFIGLIIFFNILPIFWIIADVFQIRDSKGRLISRRRSFFNNITYSSGSSSSSSGSSFGGGGGGSSGGGGASGSW